MKKRVLATIFGLTLLVPGRAAVSTWQAIRATRAGTLAGKRERETRDAATESKAILEFLVNDILGAWYPMRGQSPW